jgi:hypothetical protein
MEKTIMKAKRSQGLLAAALLCVGLALPAFAQEHTVTDSGTVDKATTDKVYPSKPPYSPYVGRNFPTRPLFGDTHLHTAMSFDAGMFGARLGPVEAYRFARGEEVTSSSGQQVRLSRPLDFLVVADHSDFMGLARTSCGKPVLADPTARRWLNSSARARLRAFNELLPSGAGKMPATMRYLPGSPSYPRRGRRPFRPRNRPMSQGGSRPSSAEWTSNTMATTCTAT